jgi:predicted DCC family thiol-disulfide oxidoreductase YuxK
LNKTKIFFDGNCIVCDSEVSRYKRMAPDLFEIVDISAVGFDAAEYGFDQNKVEFNMHVLTPTGELKIGVDAFAHIWSNFDNLKWAAKVIKYPLIYSLAKLGYWAFAHSRHLLPKKT